MTGKKTKEQEKGRNSSETDSLLVDPVRRKEEEEKTVSQSVTIQSDYGDGQEEEEEELNTSLSSMIAQQAAEAVIGSCLSSMFALREQDMEEQLPRCDDFAQIVRSLDTVSPSQNQAEFERSGSDDADDCGQRIDQLPFV